MKHMKHINITRTRLWVALSKASIFTPQRKGIEMDKTLNLSRLHETPLFQSIGPDSKHAQALRAVIHQAQSAGRSFPGAPGDFWRDQAALARSQLAALPPA